MTRHSSFHLFALGPDCPTVSQCDCTEQVAEYAQYISDAVLHHSSLSHDVLIGNHTVYLQHLRENLLVTYSPRNATQFSIYHSHSNMKNLVAMLGVKGKASPSSDAIQKVIFNPLCHQPTVVSALLETDIAPQKHTGLSQALEEIGGIGAFFMLFAKVRSLQ